MVRVKVGHYSGQFSDPDPQQQVSASRVCNWMREEGVSWCTGTEAGTQSRFAEFLEQQAGLNGLRFYKEKGGVWILTQAKLFTGKVATQFYPVIPPKAGRSEARGVLRVTGVTEKLGKVTLLAAHALTHGGSSSKGERADLNDQLFAKVASVGSRYGKGPKLCFYGGDQNDDDLKHDTFRGGPFTSLWDELGHYEETTPDGGHIDVIASFNGDHRVHGFSCHALNDRLFPTPVDHFVVLGQYDIAPKRRKP